MPPSHRYMHGFIKSPAGFPELVYYQAKGYEYINRQLIQMLAYKGVNGGA